MKDTKKAAAFAEEFRTVQNTPLHCRALNKASGETVGAHLDFLEATRDEPQFRIRVGYIIGAVIFAKKIDAFRIAFTKHMLTS